MGEGWWIGERAITERASKHLIAAIREDLVEQAEELRLVKLAAPVLVKVICGGVSMRERAGRERAGRGLGCGVGQLARTEHASDLREFVTRSDEHLVVAKKLVEAEGRPERRGEIQARYKIESQTAREAR